MFLKRRGHNRGFTLIELSIVLVIIGLVVGGVLVGQDLIRAAEVRAQITQIEKYNTAVNTFKSKYNALPGDMRPEIASQFGFVTGYGCTGTQGWRDGNGLIDGWFSPYVLIENEGETVLFWEDLSSSVAGNLIDGQFPNGGAVFECGGTWPLPTLTPGTTYLGDYFPVSKLGHGNFVYVYETGGYNWFGLSALTSVNASNVLSSSATIPVIQAYNMDKKMDDGLPMSGNVQTIYINNSNTVIQSAPNTTISGGNSTSCFDTTTGTYSVTVNNGSGANCALSFKFN